MKKVASYLLTVLLISTSIIGGCSSSAPDSGNKQSDSPAPAQNAPAQGVPAQSTPAQGAPSGTQAGPGGKYQEAPQLTEKVKKGELPPVEERLPKKPVVVDQNYFAKDTMKNWQSGKYGGAMRVSHNEPNNAPDVFFMVMQPIIRLPNGLSTENFKDNICEYLGADDRNATFTFKIREGLKWSDGKPVTTDDVRFAYEDVTLNTDITPVPPDWCTLNGKPYKLEVVDASTFKCVFPDSNGAFVRKVLLNNWIEYSRIIKPAHYLKQFHIKYTSADKLKPFLEKEGLKENEWPKLFLIKDAFDRNITSRNAIGMPVLNPWYIARVENETFVYERNPYYFKVDSSGKQLPYMDQLISPKVQDGEMENMKMISGEADILRRNAALIKMPLYKENEQKGNYETLMLELHTTAPTILFLNYAYDDESFRKVVNDIRFRKALTLGINRKEIIETVYLGMANAPGKVPSEFNAAEANKLLDEMGMKPGSNGYRNAPDGKAFSLLIESAGESTDLQPASELAAAHLRENLKINATIKKNDTTLFNQAIQANQIQARVFWGFDAMAEDEYTTRWVGPATVKWSKWITNKVAGKPTDAEGMEEPPEWAQQGITLNANRSKVVYGTEEYKKCLDNEKKYFYENIPSIPLVESSKMPLPVSKKLGNTPTGGYQISGLMAAEQMYFK